METLQCAWPKPSIPCPTTRPFWGGPEGFTLTVSEVNLSAGAGFLVALTGEIMTMPGLPKNPAAQNIDILEDGTITGLF